ncbi:activating signal cointegrator 1 complex subunit 2 [Drosophila busckii]|nr:activating signal cointegrator 1 complex subunit 2 [Drosophila busckii]
MPNNSKNKAISKKLPLSDLKFTVADEDGVRREVPALDPYWVKRNKPFGSYSCLLCSFGRIKSGAALEEWEHIAKSCLLDLTFLLRLKQHEFWSYMVYEESAATIVSSFLQRANPYYTIYKDSSDDRESSAKLLYTKLLSNVVRIIMRLLTAQESKREWIAPEEHSKLLYENYLISVPILCDLAIALGDADAENKMMLQAIFDAVLRIQPEYMKDLKNGLAFYENAFLSMQIQVDNEGCEGAGGGALFDPEADTPYDDVVLFALDCAYTLHMLFQLYPQLITGCTQLPLVRNIVNFYDLTLPMLHRNIFQLKPEASSLRWLNEARQQFLNVVRSVTNAQVEAGRGQQLVELLQECLSAQRFVVDYQRQYPVEHDIAMLLDQCPNIKQYKFEFVIAGYQKVLNASTNRLICESFEANNSHSNVEVAEQLLQPNVSVSTLPPASEATNARDIDLDVSSVLDVLPDLGTGFVRRLLARYENSEQAIAALLDDNLPPDLVGIDRQEVYLPADLQDKQQLQTGIRHYNVHDGDKFDVLTHDKPQCVIKQGKGLPGAARNAEQLLDDKRHIGQLKDRYQQYALVEETPNDDAEYDDEYDDSYESLNDGQAPPRGLLRGKLQQQAATRNSHFEAQDVIDEEESSEEESSDQQQPIKNRTDFCENPELIRERYQQRQQAKYGAPRVQGDVVGAPKGQGQNKQTTRSRNQKEANKSSRANHNRKAGAAFKRSKGMMS